MIESKYISDENFVVGFYKKKTKLEHKEVTENKCKIEFLCQSTEKHEINDADTFYFFNPFSVEVLQSVGGKIKKSYYENPREIFLFFYYPSEEYISYLMTVEELEFYDEIECEDLFDGCDIRERIMIFSLSEMG